MNWLRRMMYGRYGNDQLGNFCFIIYLILFVLQLIFRGTVAGNILIGVSYVLIIIYFFRKYIQATDGKPKVSYTDESGEKLFSFCKTEMDGAGRYKGALSMWEMSSDYSCSKGAW